MKVKPNKLEFKNRLKPKVFGATTATVPFAIKTAVENDVLDLESKSILHIVTNTSEFATPIVPITKQNGTYAVITKSLVGTSFQKFT